ncbi:elongation factor P maturation arginine rhamnosyltransferase EarP [Treponema bryantii]|uniref:elongation factor P maturation arginine rhamnosyltransferase EarP n=1 Tax=Treponema bryantii TaxID=163 RepID=UPI0003B2F99E|nr:elongation factor P maturation arginine rhamnosyltransferase EarP [Treponema bryantii]
MYITILCKVVDNFGDIGVAWRLCRRLAKIQSKYKICLVVDDLEAFAKIESSVITGAAKQSINIDDIEIFPWNNNELCHEVFSQNDGERLALILELFQCGRPDWMERILFEEKLQRTVQIIMIDYLTAEKYAEDFHCLQSLTRSAKVQKVNFMPGFTEKTGGLVIDDQWQELPVWHKDGPVLIFTYEGDWRSLLEGWLSTTVVPVVECPKGVSKPPLEQKLLVAQGRGKESFMTAVRKVVECSRSECIETNFVEELPYLNQSEWDRIMKSCSALVIRGEESMSRACLSGIPFIWHAYPQSDEYQLVKVKALLERMRPHFDEEDFDIISKAWLEINGETWIATPSARNDGTDSSLRGVQRRSNPYNQFFSSIPRLVSGFRSFAASLRKNGDLAYNLMTYIEKLDII